MPADHLDDDVISDATDGADLPAPASQHLDSCPSCQARAARFIEASRLVAAPVPPLDPQVVDALVSRATVAPAVRPAVPLVDLKQTRRLLRATPPPWAVALAAAVALVVGIPALLRVTGTERQDDLAAVSDGRSPALSERGTAGAGAGASSATTSDDLGALDSDAAVVAVLRARLDVVQSEPQLLAEPTADAADEAAAPQARVATKAAPQDSQLGNSAGPPVPACKGEAEEAASGTSGGTEPIYYAPATWQGRAAMVFVFTVAQPADDQRRQAYVMYVPGCAVVASPRF